MKRFLDLRVVQFFLIGTGFLLVIITSDGTWASANVYTYLGMVLAISGIFSYYIVEFIFWLIDKWK